MRGEGGPWSINMLIVPEFVFPYYLSKWNLLTKIFKINLKCCIKQIILFLFHNNESKCEDRLHWVFRSIGLLLTLIVRAFLVPLVTHCSLKSYLQRAKRKALNRKLKWRQQESLAQSEGDTVWTFSVVLAMRAQVETRKNAIVEYLDYQIPVTQIMGPKGNGDMQAAKRDWNAPPTSGRQI